jgi:hypothetical protein
MCPSSNLLNPHVVVKALHIDPLQRQLDLAEGTPEFTWNWVIGGQVDRESVGLGPSGKGT